MEYLVLCMKILIAQQFLLFSSVCYNSPWTMCNWFLSVHLFIELVILFSKPVNVFNQFEMALVPISAEILLWNKMKCAPPPSWLQTDFCSFNIPTQKFCQIVLCFLICYRWANQPKHRWWDCTHSSFCCHFGIHLPLTHSSQDSSQPYSFTIMVSLN